MEASSSFADIYSNLMDT